MTRLPVPRLHLIGPLDGVVVAGEYPAIAALAVKGGVDAVHVRLPGAGGGEVLDLALEIQARMRSSGETLLIVNDRIDVAQLVGAGGVHLGERSIPVSEARKLLGTRTCIGRSVHDVNGAVRAEEVGADYIIAGHVFDTDSKRGVPGRGLSWLSSITRAVSIPVIAIGGVRLDLLDEVVSTGAWGVAIGREILAAPHPGDAARALRTKMERIWDR